VTDSNATPNSKEWTTETGEDNPAQRQSDAPADASGVTRARDVTESSDRDNGRGSTANGVPASDEDAGARRKRQYEEGAGLVSGLD
jgi:hypothetical protein